MKVRVVRPIYVGGIRKEVGEIFDLPNAGDALSTGRVERIKEEPEKPAPPSGPMTTETVPEIVHGKKRKYAQKEGSDVAS